MMDYVKNISWGKNGEKMNIKIGIHVGKVIAGVLGYHKPQFSLIGDTINTTSRVMSTGEDNRITISNQAFVKISNSKSYVFKHKTVEAKGKGNMETYQIFKNKKEHEQDIEKPTET